ncbi:MAG: hypothetical protein V7750_13675, partial [Sneathiella sp.]
MHNPYATGYVPVQTQPWAGITPPPQLAPQGFFGDMIGAVAPVAGNLIGSALGNQQAGQSIGQVAGQLGGLIPFASGPSPVQLAPPSQYAPQGIWGNVISQVAPVAGNALGTAFGNQHFGSTVGNAVGQLGSLLPFSAGPGQIPVAAQAQYAPQGFFGDLVQQFAPVAGGLIGGALGNQQAGSTIGNVAGQLGGLIPFSAGPGQIPVAAQAQYAPQGFFGDLVQQFAPVAGGLIGGALGNQQAGSTIGNVAGQLGGLIPFSAGPQQAQYAP